MMGVKMEGNGIEIFFDGELISQDFDEEDELDRLCIRRQLTCPL
jgi:hypothetical protein